MDHTSNLRIYRLWAPVYDLVLGPLTRRARKRAIHALQLRPEDELLIVGVGTGLDLPLLPAGINAEGIDLSPAMLSRACRRGCTSAASVSLALMDAHELDYSDDSFDAVLMSLIVSVAPDGHRAFREGWRVLKPGGRLVIFDKFLPDHAPLTRTRRLAGAIVRLFGTDPNRRLADILGKNQAFIRSNEPALFGDLYRLVTLRKPS